MDDLEERPSKIRKLDSSIISTESQPEPFLPPTQPSDTLSVEHPSPSEETSPPQEEAQPTTQSNLSKSALKKIRKKAAWEASKDIRKAARKQKDKDKKALKATARQELAAKIAAGEIAPVVQVHQHRYVRPTQVPMGLILDCDFNDLMTEKELISLAAQATRCYSENRTAQFRTHLVISSWGGRLRERFETVLGRNHEAWKGVMFLEEGFVEAGKVVDEVMRGKMGGKIVGALKTVDEGTESSKEQDAATKTLKNEGDEPATSETSGTEPTTEENPIQETDIPPPPPSLVYLSSDSPNILTTLSPYTTYIIGGIVDKNRHKGLCQKRATELGIPTAKLPIGEFMVMNSRSVLAVNHVVEIMLRWLECGDWGEAFEKVIPKRKGGVLRSKIEEENGREDEEEEEEEQEQEEGYYDVKKEEEEEFGENYHEVGKMEGEGYDEV